MTQPNLLKERITLLRRSIVEDPDGQVKELWHEVIQVWARVKPLKLMDFGLGEGWHDPKQHRGALFKVIVRYLSNIYADRIIWRDKHYAVLTHPMADENRESASFLVESLHA